MTVLVYSYTIYHSPNAYLGTVQLRRALAGLPGVELVRRPIYVPRDRGLMIAELLGGKENRNAGSYNREDCHRWSERFAIPMSYPDPSVFHEKRDLLEQALFEAAWVEGLDVNEPATIEWAAGRAGLDPESLITALAEPGPAEEVRRALAEFERLECPGVPTVIVYGQRFSGTDQIIYRQRFFGKDRVDWVADICRAGGRAPGHQTD
jgi:2-hydroxychromene-2-carboxylate isomerase